MAEFRFFQNNIDFFELSKFLIKDMQIIFIPEISFRKKNGEKLKSVNQVKEHFEYYKKLKAPGLQYFLISNKWTKEPIYFELMKQNSNFPPFYYGQQRYGGTSLFLSIGNSVLKPIEILLPSTLCHYPYYISGSFLDSENKYETIQKPHDMKMDFERIKKVIKSNNKPKIKLHNRPYYFMNNAYDEYLKGKKLF